VKKNLTKNYEEAIIVEKDLHAIGVILEDEPKKDSKDMGKRSQPPGIRANKKEPTVLEIMTHLIKSLSTEMEEL